MEREIVLFFGWVVKGVKGDLSNILFQKTKVEWSEFDIECEFAIDHGKVANSNKVFAVIPDVQTS